MKKMWVILVLCCNLTACSLAPPYQRPAINIPAIYKEASVSKKWIPAKPTYADRHREPWWEVYHDRELNNLEESLNAANQNLKTALALYMNAQAQNQIARAAYYPTLQAAANAGRQQASGNLANPYTVSLYNDFLIGANVSYEVDVWGRVRSAVLASEKRLQASQADVAAVALSLQAELARTYFSLRGADAMQAILDKSVLAYQQALFFMRMRHRIGTAAQQAVDQAEKQLQIAKTQATELRLTRAQLEHAIAVLIGKTPAAFSCPPKPLPTAFITVSPALPSLLLERRPDIAAAERRVEAANADIGVARAAFYPRFNLSAQAGFESNVLSQLIEAPSLFWSLGPSAALTLVQPLSSVILLDGGKLQGQLNQAKASYYQTVAQYRQTVLTAFQEVEDQLAAMRQLKIEDHQQSAATQAANRSLRQAKNRYKIGISTYLEVITMENEAYQTELSLIDIRTRRHLASVQLIKALGGGWEKS
jgi:NodT family efflux transporter outer membrane factor (OMF) lipoprotein